MAWGISYAIAEETTGCRRSAQQRLDDRRGVTAQAAYFTGPGTEAYQTALLRKIDERASLAGTQVICTVHRGDRTVLAAPDELLVRTEQLQSGTVGTLLEQDLGFVQDRTAVRGAVTVFRSREELSAERLDEVLLILQSRGIPASLNHLTPLGPWAKGQGGPEPTTGTVAPAPAHVAGSPYVAIVDTGVNNDDRDDQWLAKLMTEDNRDRLDAFGPKGGPDGTLDYAAGHGTFAAGVVQQVAPDVPLQVFRALNSDGIGTEVDVAEAILAAEAAGAKVINLSLGTRTLDDQPPVAIDVALELLASDVVVVAAAGNYGDERPVWPAAFSRVVSVAALTATGHGASWSTRGFWVDFSVVGEGIVSTYVKGTESTFIDPEPDTFDPAGWAVWSGTSFAAPQLAGLIAEVAAGGSAPAALAEIATKAVRIPDFGRALRILPGT
jgi:hypothetical protein